MKKEILQSALTIGTFSGLYSDQESIPHLFDKNGPLCRRYPKYEYTIVSKVLKEDPKEKCCIRCLNQYKKQKEC